MRAVYAKLIVNLAQPKKQKKLSERNTAVFGAIFGEVVIVLALFQRYLSVRSSSSEFWDWFSGWIVKLLRPYENLSLTCLVFLILLFLQLKVPIQFSCLWCVGANEILLPAQLQRPVKENRRREVCSCILPLKSNLFPCHFDNTICSALYSPAISSPIGGKKRDIKQGKVAKHVTDQMHCLSSEFAHQLSVDLDTKEYLPHVCRCWFRCNNWRCSGRRWSTV